MLSEELDHKNLDTFAILQEVVTIVSAYFSHNAIPAADLPAFIAAVHASVVRLASPTVPVEERAPENPAVAVKRSVTKDYIVCLEDGKKFKSLRRHLSSFHNLTPDEYRAKWQLPSDYPMVAPAYSAVRSRLARDSGLGQMAGRDDGLQDDGLDDGDGEEGVTETAPAESARESRQAAASARDGKGARGKAAAEANANADDQAAAGSGGADTAEAQEGSDATASAKGGAGKGEAETPPAKPRRGRPRKQG